MADAAMIARLADLREFAELRAEFEERKEEAITKLGRQAIADPDNHTALEAHKLKAFYAGADAVLALPVKAREAAKRKENG